jgi:hypothetical protein
MSTDDQRDDHNDQPRAGGAAPEHGARDDAPRYGERITPDQAPQWGGQDQQHGQQQYGQQQSAPQWGGQQDHQQYGQQQHGHDQYGQQHGQPQQWQQGGAPAWQAPDAHAPKKKTVGVIAFVVGLAAVVVGIIGGVLLGHEFGASDSFREAMRQGSTSSDPSQYPDLMRSSSFLAGIALFYVGTALGLWAVIQGVVAIATRRGRAWGVVAIVLAVVGLIAYVAAIAAAAIGAAGGSGGI